MKEDNIHLTIVSPEKKLFEGMVKYIELPGSSGLFSVLYNHAPLISSLETGNIKFKSQGVTHRIPVRKGFVEVLDNSVSVCATEV